MRHVGGMFKNVSLSMGRPKQAAVSWFILAMVVAPELSAYQFDTGIPDLDLDITVDARYNIGMRVERQDPAILNATTFDESDSRFKADEIVTNRIDATPQISIKYSDFGFVDSVGFRASGSAFKDFAYNNDRVTCRSGTAPATNPVNGMPDPLSPRVSYCDPRVLSYSTGRFNKKAKEAAFQNAELLESFGFVNFDGEYPISLKVGRHALFWGEALLNPFLGVSYSQGPVDLNKALTVPGVSAQDVFRPVNQVSGGITLSSELTLGFQYFLDWESVRAPEGGTYLGLADPFFNAPDQLFAGNFSVLGPVNLKHMPDVSGENRNDFGVQMKWTPDFMEGGTLGFYYRKFDDILPWVHVIADPKGGPLPVGYRTVYPKGSRLYGLSVSQKVAGVSLGADVAYVPNRMLNSQTSFVDSSGLRARGGVWSGVVNSIYLGPAGTVPFTDWKVWDSSVLIAELNWSILDKVAERADLYKAVGSAACIADAKANGEMNPHADTKDGCSSRYSVGYGIIFNPIWYQVLPGIDLTGSLVFVNGLKNNSPAANAGNEGFATGSIGVSANLYQKVTAALAYNYYNSQFRTGKNADGETVVTTLNGLGLLADRDWMSLTLKYSF